MGAVDAKFSILFSLEYWWQQCEKCFKWRYLDQFPEDVDPEVLVLFWESAIVQALTVLTGKPISVVLVN